MAKIVNFNAVRGDDFIKTFEFKHSDETPVDITGWTLYFTVKQNETDDDDSAKIKKDVTVHIDPVNGKTKVQASASETNELDGKYYYDIQIKKPDASISTILKGLITFAKDITRRTT